MIGRRLLLAASAIALFALSHGQAWANENDAWTNVEVIGDGEMADLRGGIRLPNGVDLSLGAIVTTYVNGAPALQTQLTWTNAGAVVEQTIGSLGQNINDMPQEAREALGLGDVTGGVIISDATGVTALVHNVTDGALQNIILNDADGRTLTQTMSVTMQLPNFDSIQDALSLQKLGLRLSQDSIGFGD